MIESMLSTVDNPYNPFDQFDDWYAWDERSGYHSTSFLDRIAYMSDELSEEDKNLVHERAIDEIVSENVNGMFIKVSRETTDSNQ